MGGTRAPTVVGGVRQQFVLRRRLKAAQLSCRVRIVRDGVAGRISDKKELVAILLVIVVGVVVCVGVIP